MELFLAVFFWTAGLIQGLLQVMFSGCFMGRKPGLRHCLIYLLLFQAVLIPGTSPGQFLLLAALDLLLLFGVNRLLFGGEALPSFLAAALALTVRQLCSGIPTGIWSLILPFCHASRPGALPVLFFAVLPVFLSLVLCALAYYLTLKHFSIKESGNNPYLIMLITPMLLPFATGFYILNTAYGNVVVTPFPFEPAKHLELLLIQALCLCAIYSSLYAYQKLLDSFEMKSKLALLQQETHSQKTYVEEARTRYEQTRAFRHDIKNHLSVLNGLLKTDRWEEARRYLEKLEGVTEGLSFPFQTGNPVVDILLSSKLEVARQAGIKTDCAFILPHPCVIDDLDLCIIFSNALDNALHACSFVQGDKTICITGEQQGSFYLLEFENTCCLSHGFVPEAGIGLSNIKAVAEKYGGAVTAECRSSHFHLDVLLGIS